MQQTERAPLPCITFPATYCCDSWGKFRIHCARDVFLKHSFHIFKGNLKSVIRDILYIFVLIISYTSFKTYLCLNILMHMFMVLENISQKCFKNKKSLAKCKKFPIVFQNF